MHRWVLCRKLRMKKHWPTGITSHSIYAVVGMPYTPGALAQQYIFGLKPPKILGICKHGINAVPSYFDMHGVATKCHSRIVATALSRGLETQNDRRHFDKLQTLNPKL